MVVIADAPAAASDEYCIQVAKEPSPLDANAKLEKELQSAQIALLQGDSAAAEQIIGRVLAADPESIGGNRMKGTLLDMQGKPREAVSALDKALASYSKNHPKACPPAGLLSQRAELFAKIKPEVGSE